jgi:hypothetical protein
MTVASVAGDIRQTSSAAPDRLDFTETLNLMQRAEAVARSALHPADSTTQKQENSPPTCGLAVYIFHIHKTYNSYINLL